MELESLSTMNGRPKLAKANTFHHRRILQSAEAFCYMGVLLCALSILASCEPCTMAALRNQLDNDACKSYRDDSNADGQGVLTGDVTSRLASQNTVPSGSLGNVCPDSHLFCFRSILAGSKLQGSLSSEVSGVDPSVGLSARFNPVRTNVSLPSNCCILKFSRGRTISSSLYDQEGCCELPCHHSQNEKQNDEFSCGKPLLHREAGTMRKFRILVDSSPHVEISPLVLDWGRKYLYFPSLAFLRVMNTDSDNILTVYEPYSTNSQFYPCNFSEILLAPGEVASICFVFLPMWLGLSSAHLVLQTSSGGFLIQATGFAIESPYGIQPLVGMDVSSSGKWRKNLSLSNPFNEAIYVEELTAWISVSSGNTSQLTKAVCSIRSTKEQGESSLPSVNEWIDVKISEDGLPLISMKPHRNWEVGPQKTETIMELDFSFHFKGKIFGALCMQLLRSSKEKIDTVIVPLEAKLGASSAYDELTSVVSVSLDALVPCDANDASVFTLSLRNDAPYVVNVVEIREVGGSKKYFHIKYMEGLILFPSTVTQVALIFFTPQAFQTHDTPPEYPEIDMNCELVIFTNGSRTSQVKIPCKDVISVCSRQNLDSSVGYVQGSEQLEYGNIRRRSSGSAMQQPQLPSEALDTADVDELVLKSWKHHATASGMSVLDDYEVIFPVVQVGSYSSQLISVKNPSEQPVVVQLILNSAEIIDECKVVDEPFEPPFSSSLINDKSNFPSRYGFSIAEGALTEAFVHPYGRASLGPIHFQPSSLCGWKSSVLIRNNLSGVEWLPLQGFGGSLSLVLLEGSEPVQSLDFKLSLPTPRTFSAPDMLFHVKDDTSVCSRPLSKELYAKNTGDLPLEIRRIQVSGTECELDGFIVQTCEGFSLQPGESIKLKITYQTDFSAPTVQRDLELTLATGIIVIPMKVSLPMYMLSFCKKSIFWMRVKKSIVAILLIASLFFLVLCCFQPFIMAFSSQDYLLKSEKSSIARCSGKPPGAHHNQKNSNKFALPATMKGLLRSIAEEESLLLKSLGTHADGQSVMGKKDSTVKLVNYSGQNEKQTDHLTNIEREAALSSSPLANSLAVKSSVIQETKQPGNLTVKTGKDKGRRRRKKKSSGTGVSALFEVSSSQSGNSTPSSPLSPVSSLTPKRSLSQSPDVEQSVQARNPFSPVPSRQCGRSICAESNSKVNFSQPEISFKPSDKNWTRGNSTKEKPVVLHKMDGEPRILPSATFPCSGRRDSHLSCLYPFSASASTIAPHARAPGSKLNDQKAVKTGEEVEVEVEVEEKFTYNIWGDHIFAPSLSGRSEEALGLQPQVPENNSDSFFIRDPQSLMTIAQSKSANCSDQVG